MSTSEGQCNDLVATLQPIYLAEENSHIYPATNNNQGSCNDGTIHRLPTVYYQGHGNYIPSNNQQQNFIRQQHMNNYPVDLSIQCNQPPRVALYTNTVPQDFQHPMIHSNTAHHSASFLAHNPIPSTMNNPYMYSTPISAQTKRGRKDMSGNSESNIQLIPQKSYQTRIFTSNQTAHKRQRVTTQQAQAQDRAQHHRDETDQVNLDPTQPKPSVAACRFAASRFPFAPFSIIFSSEVREKMVVENLIKHAQDNNNFELKLAAFRRGLSNSKEYRILVFVENSQSFAFLYNENNWPAKLADTEFTTRKPSIPPQLAVVVQSVSQYVDWDDFCTEVKEKIPSVTNVIRFKNKAQQPLRSVKLEFTSAEARDSILDAGEINIMHMKYKVVEYFSQAKILICSNCYGIGHFRKNCPQGTESTCKTCGEKTANLKEHQCSGIAKCIHCGGSHASNDQKCDVVRKYRAAVTRNLLAETEMVRTGDVNTRKAQVSNSRGGGVDYRTYSEVAGSRSSNLHDSISQKLDIMITKFDAEFTATRSSLDEIKEEMRNRYAETNSRVDQLETKINSLEKKMEELSLKSFTLMENICTALLDPQGVQGPKWKSYWQNQIKMLIDFRSSQPKAVYHDSGERSL